MNKLLYLIVGVVLTAAPTVMVQDKDDKMAQTFARPASEFFGVMGRAIGAKWKVGHSDKDLCLVTFEAPTTMTNSGFEATATCEPAGDGTRVRIKARQKGAMSSRGREERFAKSVFDEIEKAIAK